MDFQAHCTAFSAAWIRMLVEPREAAWKKIVAHWLPCPPGHLLATLSPSDRKSILHSIPPQAAFIRSALTSFWKLKVRQDFDTALSESDAARARLP